MAYGTVKADNIIYDASGTDTTAAVSSLVTTAANNTYTGTQTYNGSSSTLGAVFKNTAEPVTIVGSAATGTINYDVTTQSIMYYTSNSTANFTINFRGSSGTTLNSLMSTGQAITCVFMNTNGGTAYYNNTIQVDGSSATIKYNGSTAWSSGNANDVDLYTYNIIKTGSAAFTIFANQANFGT